MSDKKNLPQSQATNRSVELHDNGLKAGSLISQAVSRLSKEQADSLMIKAGEEALRLEAKQHEMNMEYVNTRKNAEDHIETFNALDKTGRMTRHNVKTEVKNVNSNIQIESKSGAACFVATAAYNDPNHPDVVFLRSFRDNTLVMHATGRSFIEWYWRVGPKLAKVVSTFKMFRLIAKGTIWCIVRCIRFRFNPKNQINSR